MRPKEQVLNTSSVEEAKKSLRKKMKALRQQNCGGGKDEQILKNFFSLPEAQVGKTFFVYYAFGSEANTMPVIKRLMAQGKDVFLPRVEGKDMVAVRYTEGIPMSVNKYGITEPLGEAYTGEIEVVLLPLLAADKRGNRLGYGGGYYDKFLKERTALKIGFCYDFQVLDELCALKHDVKLDAIVTDKRIIRIKEVNH